MAMIAPNQAEVHNLRRQLSNETEAIIFVNNITIDENTVAADLVEPSSPSYSPGVTNPAWWVITPGDPSRAETPSHPNVVFQLDHTIDSLVYGWALVERGSGPEGEDEIIRVDPFASPVDVEAQNGFVAIRRVINAA